MKKQVVKKGEKKTYIMPSFDWVSWKPADMRRVLAREYKSMMKQIAAIKKIPKAQRTFENTIAALEYSQYAFADALSQVGFLMQVSTDKKVRETANKLVDVYIPKLNNITYDIVLYRAICDYSVEKNLAPHRQKLWRDLMFDYRQAGLHLPDGKRAQLQKITNKISILENKFDANIRNSLGTIKITPAETNGLPPSFLGRLEKDVDGNYLVTTRYPEIGPFMRYSSVREKRHELYILGKQKGGKQNLTILRDMRALRHKKAVLLGYPNHVDYGAEEMLAKTSLRIQDFLDTISKKLAPSLVTDFAPLRKEFKNDHGVDAEMNPWDIEYYAERVQKKFFALDHEKIREYFPLDYVMQVMLERFSKSFSIRFEKISSHNLWHSDVLCYKVHDALHERPLGIITFDLFPREGKFSHAAMFDIGPGYKVPGKNQQILPFVGIVGNMTPGGEGKPSLLSANEVRTLYHEMGHGLHGILGGQEFRSQSGVTVSHDFVELPSQLAEYWFASEELFVASTRHFQTEKRIPRDIVSMIKNQKGFLEGYSKLNQIMSSVFDLRMHDGSKGDSRTVFNDLFHQLTGMRMPKESYFPAGFGHLAGYDGKYWSYLWSEMIVAEAREMFKKAGMMNKKLGMKYRKEILEPGGSVKEEDMVQKFFGHTPTPRALLAKIQQDIKETQKFMKKKVQSTNT